MNETLINIEKLENKRTKYLRINLIGFVIWAGLRIIDNYLLSGPEPVLLVALAIGWIVWIASLLQILRLGSIVKKNKEAQEIFNDELVSQYRLKAWKFGFICVILTQAFLILSSLLFSNFSGQMAAEITLFVGITATVGAFTYFDSK